VSASLQNKSRVPSLLTAHTRQPDSQLGAANTSTRTISTAVVAMIDLLLF